MNVKREIPRKVIRYEEISYKDIIYNKCFCVKAFSIT